jgi:7-cyano-7-deazaguanine synthase
MNISKPNIVILYSGGADSMLMLKLAQMARKVPYCLLIDYGQKHVNELDFAKAQLTTEKVPWQVIKVQELNINSGLTGDLQESRWDNVHEMNVPARNTWFLSLAAAIAENKDCDEIWIGCDMSDYYGEFPDCKQEYIGRMNEVFDIAFTKPIEIVAPLLGMRKQLILDILKNNFGIKSSQMYSGYVPPESLEEGDGC